MTSIVDQVLRVKQTRNGRRPKIPRAPKQATGKTIEREYWAKVRHLLQPARALIDELLAPQLERIGRMAGVGMRRDVAQLDAEPWADVVASIMAEVRKQYDAATSTEIESVVSEFGSQTDAFNMVEVRRQMRSMLGIDIWTEIPEIGPMLQAWGVDNVGLIKSIPETYFSQVEGMVLRSFNAGTRAEELAPRIAKRFAVSESRGMLIARDQISKLTGDLTRQRQTSLGIEKYRWRTSQDERVRASHRRLNNKVFSWDKPPVTNSAGDRNHPGGDYQCRCTAEPVIGDLLDDDEAAAARKKSKTPWGKAGFTKEQRGLYKATEGPNAGLEIREGPNGWMVNGGGFRGTQFQSLREAVSGIEYHRKRGDVP